MSTILAEKTILTTCRFAIDGGPGRDRLFTALKYALVEGVTPVLFTLNDGRTVAAYISGILLDEMAETSEERKGHEFIVTGSIDGHEFIAHYNSYSRSGYLEM